MTDSIPKDSDLYKRRLVKLVKDSLSRGVFYGTDRVQAIKLRRGQVLIQRHWHCNFVPAYDLDGFMDGGGRQLRAQLVPRKYDDVT